MVTENLQEIEFELNIDTLKDLGYNIKETTNGQKIRKFGGHGSDKK